MMLSAVGKTTLNWNIRTLGKNTFCTEEYEIKKQNMGSYR